MNVSNDRTFLKVNNSAPINLRWQPKLSGNKSMTWKHSFCNTLALFGERGQSAESKGDNRLPVLALHSKRNEELKRFVIYCLCVHAASSKTVSIAFVIIDSGAVWKIRTLRRFYLGVTSWQLSLAKTINPFSCCDNNNNNSTTTTAAAAAAITATLEMLFFLTLLGYINFKTFVNEKCANEFSLSETNEEIILFGNVE